MLNCNLHEDEDQIYIQIVIVIHRTECKPKSVALNWLNRGSQIY